MATERVGEFARRVGNEVRDFAGDKGRELAGRVQEKVQEGVERVQEVASMVASEADAKVYQAALGVVAKHFSLTTEEVERRLTAVDVGVTVPVRPVARMHKGVTRKTSKSTSTKSEL